MGGNLNFGHHHSIPTYSRTIQSKFHQNLRIFSKNVIQEKVTRYTGQLRGGRRGLNSDHNCSSLMLIHMFILGPQLTKDKRGGGQIWVQGLGLFNETDSDTKYGENWLINFRVIRGDGT